MSRILLDSIDKKDITQVGGGTSKVFKIKYKDDLYFFKKNYERNDSERVTKYFEQQFEESVNELCADVVEVFSYYFLKEIGIDFCVPYKLAALNGANGCLSKSFIEDNEDMISIVDIMNLNYLSSTGHDVEFNYKPITSEFEEFYKSYKDEQKKKGIPYNLAIEDIIVDLSQFAKTYKFSFNENEIKKQLQMIMLLDYFMCNGDRNWSNVKFVFDEGSKILRLAPIFDNGDCFQMEQMVSKKHDEDQVFFHLGSVGRLENNTLSNNECVAKQIFAMCKQNSEMNNLLHKCLSLNIFHLIAEVEKIEDFKFTKRQKDVLEKAYSDQVANFKKFNPELIPENCVCEKK